nr:MAG TPA: hypothetical protein [Caudoviricetes sp.]DAQ38662.1 MAG TPA: hypothetical protein [Caudoviricetes sp.]
MLFKFHVFSPSILPACRGFLRWSPLLSIVYHKHTYMSIGEV